ncbi:hypothetical protein BpHYR1_009656 [Brachionus plicatilis]|uniref:Uncharacterized protein n=1 Tax=Brachionus plicatilis TaxID=10195 RepID=A0A3M7PR09_BRAPC|nr:hypothetical protein BpHYR1_009656 [Brachionus plicatilis]
MALGNGLREIIAIAVKTIAATSVVVPAMTKRTFASTSSALLVNSSFTPFHSRSRTCLCEKNESVVLLKKLSRLLLGCKNYLFLFKIDDQMSLFYVQHGATYIVASNVIRCVTNIIIRIY